jgi:hypothetical protein
VDGVVELLADLIRCRHRVFPTAADVVQTLVLRGEE